MTRISLSKRGGGTHRRRKANAAPVTNHHPAAILNPRHFATATYRLDKNVTFVFYSAIFSTFSRSPISNCGFAQIRVRRHFLKIRTIIFNDCLIFFSLFSVSLFWTPLSQTLIRAAAAMLAQLCFSCTALPMLFTLSPQRIKKTIISLISRD